MTAASYPSGYPQGRPSVPPPSRNDVLLLQPVVTRTGRQRHRPPITKRCLHQSRLLVAVISTGPANSIFHPMNRTGRMDGHAACTCARSGPRATGHRCAGRHWHRGKLLQGAGCHRDLVHRSSCQAVPPGLRLAIKRWAIENRPFFQSAGVSSQGGDRGAGSGRAAARRRWASLVIATDADREGG